MLVIISEISGESTSKEQCNLHLVDQESGSNKQTNRKGLRQDRP